MHRYRISGLAVSSDIELPGLFSDRAQAGECDVTIARMPVPETLENATQTGPVWAMAPKRFLLRIPGIVRFLLSEGRTIKYEPEAGASHDDITAFLIGTAFGILLHQRGLVVLHASSVCVNGKAALFLGASGAGKSTIAMALGQRGYGLVTDDFCAIRIGAHGVPLVYPDGRLHKLWTEAIDQLDLAAQRGEPVRGRLEKFYVEPATAPSPDGPLPVGAVYALREARPPFRAGIQRPNAVDTATLLRQNAYRPGLVQKMEHDAQYFELMVVIGNGTGVFHLTRELRFSAMSEAIAGLERHWIELGIRAEDA